MHPEDIRVVNVQFRKGDISLGKRAAEFTPVVETIIPEEKSLEIFAGQLLEEFLAHQQLLVSGGSGPEVEKAQDIIEPGPFAMEQAGVRGA
jgi:hypothetical protein